MQFHGGVYRSDDAARSWTSIAEGLPSDFGFPMVIDPNDPDAAYVIPLNSDLDRVSAEGRLRVFETRDAGATLDRPDRRAPAGRRVPHDPAAGVRPRRRDSAGPVVRCDVGRRVRVLGCRCDLARGGSGPRARPVGPRRLRGAGSSPRGRPGTAPSCSGGSSVVLFVLVVVAPSSASSAVSVRRSRLRRLRGRARRPSPVPRGGSQSHSPGSCASRLGSRIRSRSSCRVSRSMPPPLARTRSSNPSRVAGAHPGRGRHVNVWRRSAPRRFDRHGSGNTGYLHDVYTCVGFTGTRGGASMAPGGPGRPVFVCPGPYRLRTVPKTSRGEARSLRRLRGGE